MKKVLALVVVFCCVALAQMSLFCCDQCDGQDKGCSCNKPNPPAKVVEESK